MDKDHIVKAFEDKGEAQFGSHRYTVEFEGNEELVSLFAKFPPQIGKPLFGRIEVVKKGDKEYHNFKFAKKDQSPASRDAGLAEIKNILNLKVLPMLAEILNGRASAKPDYPEMTSENDGHEEAPF